jgi:hypothetical protein
MSYKTRHIQLNHPNKVLACSCSAIAGQDYWPYQNGSGDLWYEGSASPKYYRWEITFNVTAQNHGSHLTRDDFQYNGLDVQVGDWVAGATDGKALKIISISSKTKTSVTAVVEDWLRYNTFKSTTGNGIFGTGSIVVFQLNEQGIPMLDPLPTSVSSSFFTEVFSRFNYLNPQLNYVLEKESHGFSKGDVIAVSITDGFVKANAITAAQMIGVVTESGPGPDQFMILPNNRIIDFDPTIPGVQGENIYVDTDGSLSNTSTGTSKVAFLNIRSAIPTVLTGDQGNPVVGNGNVIAFNGVDITFGGQGGSANVNEIATLLNSETSNTSIVADVLPLENTITSDADSTIYGLVGGYVPFSAYIDSGSGNTLINFTSNGSVYATVSTPQDMKTDIDAVNIANLNVTATATVLTLTELNGNAITISNGNAETGGYFFVGASNISGLPASTAATNAEKLKLTRSDGGEILIYEDSDIFQTQTGIFSAHTGSVPLAMNIEQGVRTGGTTVVGTIGARDALVPAAGDQAYVTNKGDGEWGLYLYTGGAWVEISNADSATVDAKTLTTTFTMPTSGFGNSTTQNLGNISPGRKILNVTVSVDTTFSGYTGSTLPNIEIGTIADPDAYCDSPSNDLTELADFVCTPDYVYPATNIQDQLIRARCNHYQSSAGNVTVTLTYV